MFPFLKKNNSAPDARCVELVGKVRPEVAQLMSYAPGPANKAMTEYYATLYFVWLARDPESWVSLLPRLPEAALSSLTMMRLRPEDRKKRLRDIRLYWKNLQREEAALVRLGRNPLLWLENRQSGLAGIAAADREYADTLLPVVTALVRRLKLKNYEKFVLPQEDKPPLSDLRPQPPRPEQYLTLTDPQGQSARMQVLDVITTADGTFACLRKEGSEQIVILKTVSRSDGRSAYAPAEETHARLVMAVFRTRNPQYFPES